MPALLLVSSGSEAVRGDEAARQRRAAEMFFESRVRPVLLDRCIDCHGPDAAEGELRVDSLAALFRGGSRGPAVVAGKPEESLLIRAIRHGEVLKMPPKSKLPAAEIAALARWVADGPVWPGQAPADDSPAAEQPKAKEPGSKAGDAASAGGFWAFEPIRRPVLPSVRNGQWMESPLDAFILHRLEAAGLSPAPPADKRTLLRRATFDLLGLPPTPEEVEAFLADDRPDAFARAVDRLLASPRYGERWGRHWLDVARYADSNGLDENLAYAHAFRYRDYVISAFNRNLPLDRFIQEQIAGDLLPAASERDATRQVVATGLLCIGPKMLAEDDPVKLRMDIIDEQVDTLGRAFMGMTLGCARCHDHKFDPVSMRDYYALAGIFHSTQTMDTFTVVAQWHERPLATPEARRRLAEHQRRVEELERQIAARREAAGRALLADARRHAGDYLLAAQRMIQRQRLLDELQPIGPRVASDPPKDVLLREAEQYDRGNVLRDTTNYGQGIGVLVNQGTTPNFTEYDIEIAAGGAYRLEVRYAAAAARPCRLYVDGRLVDSQIADGVTGTWFPDSQTWHVETILTLEAGPHVLRLEQPQFFPHIDKLLLAKVDAPETAASLAPLAADYPLVTPWVERWAALLRTPGQADSESSPLHPWRATAAAGGADSLRSLARVYQQAAESDPDPTADKTAGSEQPLLSRAQQAAFRQLLESPDSPFTAAKGWEELESHFDPEARTALAALRKEHEELAKNEPSLPTAMAVAEAKGEDLRLHYRGSHLTLGPVVPRGLPEVLAPGASTEAAIGDGSGRLELARWLTSPTHPLTARVMANRVWLWHFGEGLVRTPDNFGRLGERPTHPELLDWLASRLLETGWDLKALHREILLSATWRQSTRHDPQAAQRDPENRLWWRANRRRLEAESVRDGLLAVAGTLDTRMGGSLLPTPNRKYVTSTANVNPVVYVSNRRSVYLPVVRSALYEVFQAFDFADPSALSGQRQATTVAPQALFMMNSRFVSEQTRHLAERLLSDSSLTDEGRVRQLYLLAYGRPAEASEVERALDYAAAYERRARDAARGDSPGDSGARLEAWQSLCRAVLAANEFIFVR